MMNNTTNTNQDKPIDVAVHLFENGMTPIPLHNPHSSSTASSLHSPEQSSILSLQSQFSLIFNPINH